MSGMVLTRAWSDFEQNALLADIDTYNVLINPMASNVYSLFVMVRKNSSSRSNVNPCHFIFRNTSMNVWLHRIHSCHSGTVLTTPYQYKANGLYNQMHIHEGFNFAKLFAWLKEEFASVF